MHREEGEVYSLHLLIAALGLHRLGLVVLLLGCCSSLLPQLPLSLCDFLAVISWNKSSRTRLIPPRWCWLCLTSAESSCPT